MPPAGILLAFLVTTAAFACIPGPAMLYAAAQTLARGRRSGLLAALGIHMGGYVHVVAAASGLSILFHVVPGLYMAVKLAGAGYLIWMGIQMVRAKSQDGTAAQDETALPVFEAKSGRRAFVESVTVEILNPKTAIFFLAFLPQFVDASAAFPVWVQFVILGTVVNLAFSATDMVCVLLAGALIGRLRRSGRAQRLMRRAGGAMLVGLGTHLALQRT